MFLLVSLRVTASRGLIPNYRYASHPNDIPEKHVLSSLMKICTLNGSPCPNLQFYNAQTGELAHAHSRCPRAVAEPKGTHIFLDV